MIYLTRFEEKDFDRLISWVTDADMMMMWGGPTFTFPLTREQLADFTAGANEPDAEMHAFNVIISGTDEKAGFITINSIDRVENRAKIGKVLIADQARGRGICVPLIKEISRVAFEELELGELYLGVFDFNHPAIRCYEQAGFQTYEYVPDIRYLYGDYHGVWRMKLTREQFASQKRPDHST
ncbi:GNAT family N-acetyltransferase [Salisediminibacterium halotolerans]|uniref:Protein N-acetyltransferase, RimJ/RimL family n=1 Tax=Salisediminibacterium halotolerans TaxID=517425 RepID=A0A1H9RFT4_9BACI|nr:GNAT family protein [Salisediminibacterium haloalkalitolerans]SER71415.1 Protein N-acetyltransferase, RimJ/RimL family [Salisediminibacterium haloalkalitolerans]